MGRGVASRFTFDAGRADDPAWSPDGRQVAYSVSSPDGWKIYAKAADGTGSPKELLSIADTVHPGAWSPDGKFLAYDAVNSKSKKFEVWGIFYYDPSTNKVMLVPVTEKGDSLAFGDGASFSPDWKRCHLLAHWRRDYWVLADGKQLASRAAKIAKVSF